MAAKEVKFGEEARQRMKRGVDLLANAVKATPVSYTHLRAHETR